MESATAIFLIAIGGGALALSSSWKCFAGFSLLGLGPQFWILVAVTVCSLTDSESSEM